LKIIVFIDMAHYILVSEKSAATIVRMESSKDHICH